MSEKRSDEARIAIERVINDFVDVFVDEEDDEGRMRMPVLCDWVLLTTHDDIIDPTVGASYRMCRENQSTHQTAGLLTIALDQFMHPWKDD